MTAFRRAISVILYFFAGMFLMTWAMMSFVGSEPDLPKMMMMSIMAILSSVPLALGALSSPGERAREVGIVLLVAAGWAGFTALVLGLLILDPQFMAMMPPDAEQSFAVFNDPIFGVVVIIAMAGLGTYLMRWRRGFAAQDEDRSSS